MRFRFDEEKFVNAVLFFAKNADAASFGVTKLNKQLYYSDFEHFKLYGRPIIGDRYVNMKEGPVPSTSYGIINDLLLGSDNVSLSKKLAKKIEVKKSTFKDYKIHRVKALAEPDMDVFSQSEIDVMTQVADVCKRRNLSATFLSKLTHTEGSPWSKTERNQEIDYRLVLDASSDEAVSIDYVDFLNKETDELGQILNSSPNVVHEGTN